MDISDTYFELLPIELIYLVLYSSNMKDICNFLGYNFFETHKQFFGSIIKRDFDERILTDLIDIEKFKTLPIQLGMLLYNTFLLDYKENISRIKQRTGTTIPARLLISPQYFKFADLDKIGIDSNLIKKDELSETSMKDNIKGNEDCIGIFDIINGRPLLHTVFNTYHITKDLSFISVCNLIFFFHYLKIFIIK
jgi:hypothetical protein